MGSTRQATDKGVKKPSPVKTKKTAAKRVRAKTDETPSLVI